MKAHSCLERRRQHKFWGERHLLGGLLYADGRGAGR
jgi:hypothetical protein